jgi:hypothetical protein
MARGPPWQQPARARGLARAGSLPLEKADSDRSIHIGFFEGVVALA